MGKKSLNLIFILSILMISLVFSSGGVRGEQTCTESSSKGYLNRAFLCNAGSECKIGCNPQEGSRCQDNPWNACRTEGSSDVKWEYTGNRCKRKFNCPDSYWTNEYRCSGDDRERKYVTVSCGSNYDSCPTSSSWHNVESCEYGCSEGVCNTCAPNCDGKECGSDGCGGNCGSCQDFQTCDSHQCKDLESASWANMRKQIISEAQVNDRVYLKAVSESGADLSGQEINYSIEKENTGFWSFLNPWNELDVVGSDVGYVSWKPTEEGEYRFTASIEGSDVEQESEILNATSSEDNTPPVAEITSPEDKRIYLESNSILFNQTSHDEDDFFFYIWNLGNDVIKTGNSSNLNNWSFEYSYTNSGQKSVVLNIEDERGLKDSNSSEISIAKDGTNVFAYIDEPEKGENFENNKIDFNANSSYVYNFSSDSFTCLGGNCPSETGEGDSIDETNNRDYSDMNFSWNFYSLEEGNEEHLPEYSVSGLGNKSFTRNFNKGEYKAELEVFFNSESSTTSNVFSTSSYNEKCASSDSGLWIKEDGSEHNTTLDSFNCTTESNGECCLEGYSCNNGNCEETPGYCEETSVNNGSVCGSYKTQEKCVQDLCKFGREESSYKPNSWDSAHCGEKRAYETSGGYYYVDCGTGSICEWDDSEEICEAVTNRTSIDNSGERYTCSFSENVEGDCSTGDFVSINYITKLTDSFGEVINDSDIKSEQNCVTEERIVPCPQRAKLGFFGFFNILIALIIISAIYAFYKKN